MWKRLDEGISLSEKHARLSWMALGVWTYILPNTDAKGRYSADTKVIKARCMTYRDEIRLEQVEDALKELERERVLHLYTSGSKRYLVMHDHAEYNPPGALRYQDAKNPDPPDDLCQCLRQECGVKTPPVTSSSSSLSSLEGVEGEPTPPPEPKPILNARDETLRQLFALARKQKVAATDETLRNRLDAWVARLGADVVHAKLMEPTTVGRTVNELQDQWFPKVVPPKPEQPAQNGMRANAARCGVCDDKKVIRMAPDGKGGWVMGPCSCQRKRA